MKREMIILSCLAAMMAAIIAGAAPAAEKSVTLMDIALYKGPDRQKFLEEGAKKEGKLVFYTTSTESREIVRAFQQEYPFVRVELWRAGTTTFLPRILEEYKAGKHAVGVLGPSKASQIVLEEAGILHPFFSPELAQIEEGALIAAPGGAVLSAAHFQSGLGVGYNSRLLKKDQAPTTYRDLLHPKWKGKMAIVGDKTGAQWMAALLHAHGEEFVRAMAKQEFDIHVVSGRTLNDMIIAGEYVLSPTIYDSHVNVSKKKGAPVDWIPLEPVSCSLNQIALPKHSAQPYAAMLYIDFDLSYKAGKIYEAAGYNSPRKDISSQRPYKKYYPFNSTQEVVALTDQFDRIFFSK